MTKRRRAPPRAAQTARIALSEMPVQLATPLLRLIGALRLQVAPDTSAVTSPVTYLPEKHEVSNDWICES